MEPRTTTSVALKSLPIVVLKRNPAIVSILMSVMVRASIESWPIEAVPEKSCSVFVVVQTEYLVL